ncbi:MAG TPA: hypothetical protein VI434_02135 [Candidatus Dormibacteraeota bacterium]
MVWLANHRWWTLAAAFVVLLLGLLLSTAFLSSFPVVPVLFLLFFASLMALAGTRGSRRPPGSH